MECMYKVPDYVRGVIGTLEKAGFKAYAVGGCVRDILLGREPSDWDIATSAPCEKISDVFSHTIPTGERYGTITVLYNGEKAEVTTFRSDGEYKNGRRPENVQFIDDVTKDLCRRDFTINAMAMSKEGTVIDLFGGREDLERNIIKCVGEPDVRFKEDALRMFRALRFSAVLGFSVDPSTLTAIRQNALLAERLSAERVRDEIEKTLISERPEIVAHMIGYGLMSRFISKNGKKIDLSGLKLIPAEKQSRWCALSFILRRQGTVFGAEDFLSALRLPSRTVKAAKKADAAANALTLEQNNIRLALAEYGESCVILAAFSKKAWDGVDYPEPVTREIELHKFVPVHELDIKGDELISAGFSGAEIGKVLGKLSNAATLGEVLNRHDALFGYAAEIKERGTI